MNISLDVSCCGNVDGLPLMPCDSVTGLCGSFFCPLYAALFYLVEENLICSDELVDTKSTPSSIVRPQQVEILEFHWLLTEI